MATEWRKDGKPTLRWSDSPRTTGVRKIGNDGARISLVPYVIASRLSFSAF